MKITILALVMAAVALSGIMSAASAEIVPSPLQQVQNGVPIGEVVCSEDRILMLSSSGSPVCVNESSTSAFLQRGFTMGFVQDVPTVISNELPIWHTYESDIKLGGHASSGGSGYSPVSYTIGLPDSFTIGETVSIPYSFSWQYENGTTKYEQLGTPEPDVYHASLGLIISDEFSVLDDNTMVGTGLGDRYAPHTASMMLVHVTSSGLMFNGTLDLRLDTAMYHDRDMLMIPIYGDVYAFQVQRTDAGARLVDRDLLTDPYDLEHLNAFDITRPHNGPDGRYEMTYRPENGTFTHIPEMRPSNTEPRTPEPSHENLYIPKDGWPDFAEFLRSEIEFRNITDARGWMIENDLSKEFVADFLTQYQEFATTGADEPVIITVSSKQFTGTYGTNRPDNIHGIAPYCPLPSAISVQVPNKAEVGEPFDVVIIPSYELTQGEMDEFNRYHRTDLDDVEDIWEEYCYSKSFYLEAPYNYEPSGETVATDVTFSIETGYYPPYKTYKHFFDVTSDLDTPSITFQITVSEPVIYTRADLYDRNNTDYYKYDFGRLHIESMDNLFARYSVSIYTSISDNDVILSEHEPVRFQPDNGETHNLNEQFVPYKTVDRHVYTVYHPDDLMGSEARSDAPENATSRDVPFEWIAESLETGPYAGSDPEEFIKRFGLDDDYVRRFLEAYPQYQVTTSTG